MNLKKTNKNINRLFIRLKKRYSKRAKLLLFKSKPSRILRKYLKMEASRAFAILFRHALVQYKLRPRIKLISRSLLILLLVLFGAQLASDELRAKEDQIKINGRAVLVASNQPQESEQVISAVVEPKISPFSYTNPVDDGIISQSFGKYHKGLDIAASLGSNIKPIGEGKVEFTGYTADGKGNIVVVDHGDGLKTVYAHLGKIEVGVGNAVNKNTVIGTVGLTGRTTGPHLHIEVYDGEVPMNPAQVLP